MTNYSRKNKPPKIFSVLEGKYDREFLLGAYNHLYIGHSTIQKYKKTEIYQGHYDYFINEERKQKCVTNVVKHQYININKIDDILKQKLFLFYFLLIFVLVIVCK